MVYTEFMPEQTFAPLSDHQLPPTYQYFNGKEWVASKSGKATEIKSPVDGEVVGKLQIVTHDEIDAVLEKAKQVQPLWEATPLHARVKMMHLTADWIRQMEEYFTNLLMREIGKTMSDAKSEIGRTADLIDYIADEAISLRGETLDSDNFPGFEKGRTAIIERVAHGVVVCIAPFNYPVNLSASKIVPALLMGNTVVFKPPTQGGISALHLSQLFQKAGLPEGVMSVVTGSGEEIGDYLVTHKNINMVAFTGSSDVGVHIATQTGMIPLLFECGGNNPSIVLPDADMEPTAREIIKGGFSYAGQRCTAIKYILGTQSTLDTLLPIILANMKDMVVMGDPRSPETKLVGPVITEAAAAKIQATVDEAVKGGAEVVAGGKTKGNYVEATLLKNVKPDMNVVATEVFGPVISFITVTSIDEAISIINTSAYGLQASVFTKDEGTGLVISKKINAGTVQINGSPQRGPDHFPFMGVKHSGLGVQGVRYSLEAMSRLKSTVINKPA
jgi:glyceraldehyde-3-phosphate dehydrogenase (NADP+)